MIEIAPDHVIDNEQAPHLREAFVSGQSVYDGGLLKVYRDQIELPDGQTSCREYVKHPGAVMVMALLDDGRVVVERQYRYPMGRVMLEFVAGKLDPAEEPFVCAQRELKEETGYRASQWAYLGAIHPLIAYSTEVIHIFLAKGLQAGPPQRDVGEHMDVGAIHPSGLVQAVLSGQVTDGKTVAGVFWLERYLSGALTVSWLTPSQI